MGNVLYLVIICLVLQDPGAGGAEPQDYESLVQRARSEYWNGRLAESEVLFLAALRKSLPTDDIRLARAMSELADVYVNKDELPKAESFYLESLALYKKVADEAKVIFMLRNLGAVYSLQRRDDEALRVLQQALKSARVASQPDPVLLSQILNALGVVYYRERNMTKAEKCFTEAVQVLPHVDGLYGRADLLNNLGAIYHYRHQPEKAEQYYEKALRIMEAQVGPAHPDLTFSLSLLAVLYTDTGQYAKAEGQYQRALAILELNKSVFETRIARLLHGMSATYIIAGRRADAEAALARASAIARRNAADHPDMAIIMDAYSATLKKSGKTKEAEELRVEAKRARAAAALVVNVRSAF